LVTSGENTSHRAGENSPAATYSCTECGQRIALESSEPLPACERCGGTEFRRASMFTTTHEAPVVIDQERSPELERVRPSSIAGPALAVAAHGAQARVFAIEPGWTLVGRSTRAAIRLDDPTVSRRHALLIRTPDEELRVMDDRSLNGVFVNGERIEWAALDDGDELDIGCYRARVLLPHRARAGRRRRFGRDSPIVR
jgi:hypothetical protein